MSNMCIELKQVKTKHRTAFSHLKKKIDYQDLDKALLTLKKVNQDFRLTAKKSNVKTTSEYYHKGIRNAVKRHIEFLVTSGRLKIRKNQYISCHTVVYSKTSTVIEVALRTRIK